MTDCLDEKRREITDRLHELKPLVDEFNRLEAAAAALASAVGSAASDAGHAVTRHRGRRRRRGSARHRAATTNSGHRARGSSGAPKSKSTQSESGQETRRSPRETSRRQTQRQRHARRSGALRRGGSGGDHDGGACREYGDRHQLPLQGAAGAGEGREDSQGGAGVACDGGVRSRRPDAITAPPGARASLTCGGHVI